MLKKGINLLKYFLISITLLMLGVLIYGFYTVPDEIYAVSDKYINVKNYYTVSYSENVLKTENLKKSINEGQYKVDVKLFNAIPIKSSSLKVSQRKYVVPSGEILGLRFFTDGVVIVGIDSVDTAGGSVSPAKNAGLKKGDVITSINGKKAENSNSVLEIISSSLGNSIQVCFTRDNNEYTTYLTPMLSVSENRYKAGIWIRDSAAGIGTMTFYDPQSGVFGALGHGVCDVDTGEILPLSEGDTVQAEITGCYKGKQGQAGELCGVFTEESLGLININCEQGVYGTLYDYSDAENLISIATVQEIKTGKAQIISTVDENGPQYYDIEILKITTDGTNKNMVIQVTDQSLIEKTGGIVQGMSGSPIIQNDMLVGAVTHVLVGEPTKGYGIFIESMLETARSVEQSNSLKDAG